MGRIGAVWLALIVSVDAIAHHAFTGYDTDNLQSIDGVVTEVFWRNPHVELMIERILEDGRKETWEAEGGALNSLQRAGVGRKLVAVGDRIVLRLELWDGVRTIHLAEDAPAEGQPASPFGYSTGRWENNALIVVTARIDDRYFDMVGTPQSEALEVVERFELNDTVDRLDYHAEITDPATFFEPATVSGSWSWVPGEEVKPFECTLRDE